MFNGAVNIVYGTSLPADSLSNPTYPTDSFSEVETILIDGAPPILSSAGAPNLGSSSSHLDETSIKTFSAIAKVICRKEVAIAAITLAVVAIAYKIFSKPTVKDPLRKQPKSNKFFNSTL